MILQAWTISFKNHPKNLIFLILSKSSDSNSEGRKYVLGSFKTSSKGKKLIGKSKISLKKLRGISKIA